VLKKDPAEISSGLDGHLYSPAGFSDEAHNNTAFSIIGAIKSASFWYLFLVWFWFSFCLYMVITHIVPRAQDIGLEPMRAATVMSILTAVNAVSRLAGGLTADLVDKRKLLAILITVMSLSMVWLTTADQSWKIYLFAILFGMFSGAGDISGIAVVADVFGTAKVGTMMGILMIGWGLGSAAGPYLAGWVFDHTGSYRWAFIIAAGGLMLSAFACLRLQIADK
jgi:MFS family permease